MYVETLEPQATLVMMIITIRAVLRGCVTPSGITKSIEELYMVQIAVISRRLVCLQFVRMIHNQIVFENRLSILQRLIIVNVDLFLEPKRASAGF